MRVPGSSLTFVSLVLFCVALLLPPPARAADPSFAFTAESLQLKDGRVLHNVKLMSIEADGVVVNAAEGLLKLPKAVLPQAVLDGLQATPAPTGAPGMVMEPFNPNLPKAGPTPTPHSKPTPKPTPTPNPVFKGCTIASYQMKPFQSVLGSAEVVIQNDTESAVVIMPGDLVCVTASGAQHRGRQFVVDAYPPIIRRREIIPAHGTLDDLVVFTNEALDASLVRWVK